MKSLSDSNKISNITKSLINLFFIAFKREQMVDKYEISQSLNPLFSHRKLLFVSQFFMA
jgi:hypothetical protein